MLDLLESRAGKPIVLCDLGCGTGELLAHIHRRGLEDITYIGADRSAPALALARAKFPTATFIEIDVTSPDADVGSIACDYLVANGVFTLKFELRYEQMWNFLAATIERLWPVVRQGLAFNVMSKIVDLERDDRFHVSMDDTARLLHRFAGRHLRLRADYGLCEYTAFAFKLEQSNFPTDPARSFDKPEAIPVLRPKMPRANQIIPYLRRLDATRVYSNHGPLLRELEGRLTSHLRMPQGALACASSGTSAIVGAILAAAGRASANRPLAIIPAFTFVATAAAAEQCGYIPYLADIDAVSWMLDPERLIRHPELGRIGVVIPVAPFGRAVPQQSWVDFFQETRIPVVIDGAASFDSIADAPDEFLGPVPVAISFHATKGFGTGEGGGVVSTDIDFIARVVQALNFGFSTTRDSRMASINGKMSEYHAMVGLAELDQWREQRAKLHSVIDIYRRKMTEAELADRFIGSPDIGLSYALWRCRDTAEAELVENELTENHIGWRLWYGTGLQDQTYYAASAQDDLSVTKALAPCILGLPMAPDLSEESITRIALALTKSLEKRL